MPLLRKPALNRIRVDPLATNPRPGSKIKQSYKTDDENPENPMEKSRARHAATPSHPRVVFRHYTRCRDLLSVVKRRQIQYKHATSLWSGLPNCGSRRWRPLSYLGAIFHRARSIIKIYVLPLGDGFSWWLWLWFYLTFAFRWVIS